MTLGSLRPVGEWVPLFPGNDRFSWPPGFEIAWLDSGTSALGVAIRAIFDLRPEHANRVIVPAYTCADVVSAVLWAGGRPLVVDTQPGTPWLDLARVAEQLDGQVAAVVAPHFLGIAHPLGQLSALCATRGVELVEDSAQLGPASIAFRPAADLVVLSFGRGKPVPAGGGALLYRGPAAASVRRVLGQLRSRDATSAGWRSRVLLQNMAMTRLGFGIARRLPGLDVGATRYHALTEPTRLPDSWTRLIEAVLAGWASRKSGVAASLSREITQAGVYDLAGALGWDGSAPLLRLPLLAESAPQRDAVVDFLVGRGVGASGYYRAPLPQLDSMPELEIAGSLADAADFADRLLTLPCHSGVTADDQNRMEKAVVARLSVSSRTHQKLNQSAESGIDCV